jgi:hypothetical protein
MIVKIAVKITEDPLPLPLDEPAPGIHFTNTSAVGVVFSASQAAEMFEDYPGLSAVICVDIPRAMLVRCVADAVHFYGATKRESE